MVNFCKYKLFIQICRRVNRFYLKVRFQPIRVFCFHHVSDEYDPLRMWESDWIQTDKFKHIVEQLRSKYEFIPLTQAKRHLENDFFRRKKYAVLTCDDGYASIKGILPWLRERSIPITLFINPRYLSGTSWSTIIELQANRVNYNVNMLDVSKGLYLTLNEMNHFGEENVQFGSHGFEHVDALKGSLDDFKNSVVKTIEVIHGNEGFVPFHAYTWGSHNNETDSILRDMNMTPVYLDQMKNYNNPNIIHRELLDGYLINKHK